MLPAALALFIVVLFVVLFLVANAATAATTRSGRRALGALGFRTLSLLRRPGRFLAFARALSEATARTAT